jgi:DNA-binding SARP family transcriptional activator
MDGPATRIDLCGQLRLELLGERREAQLRGRQGRMLFAFLVLNRRRPVRRDELVEALWADDGGTPPSEAALAPLLSRLRRAVAPGGVEGRESVALELPGPVVVDVEEALGALAAAREALAAGRPADAAQAARRAAELTAAGLLPGLEATWVDAWRVQVDDARVEALELAAAAGLALGGAALPQAEADARGAVVAAPYRESARSALIRVLAARGNVAEALRAYEDVRTLLRDELGTVPGPELMAVHQQLLGAAPQEPAEPEPQPVLAAPAAAAGGAAAPDDLVERDDELRRIAAAAARLADGRGGVLLLEGPAGIGKTRLLSELRDRAVAAGADVREARATTLEREYGFGVARQLFDGIGPDHPAVAAAPGARAVLGHGDSSAAGEGLFAAFHGLHHVVAELADERPLLLAIDDLQWSDTESLRFVAYLARRLARVPVLLAATIRTGEPGVEEELLAELAVDPEVDVVEPQPLTGAAAAQLVRLRLGAQADEAFAAACHTVTAGNPLLLRQLLTALEAEGVVPDAAHAADVRAIGPRAVARTVLLRLARLPGGTVAVARAVAVLGENPGLPAIAALADIPEAEAADAIDVLYRAEILRGDGPLGFVHPLVRDAVYNELPAARRALEHARAAHVLADTGASPEAVAAQLLRAPERGDAWVVDRLWEAAEVAQQRGAPQPARVYLERALAEPPEPARRGTVAVELGRVASYLNGPSAVPPLRHAVAVLTDPAQRAEAVFQLVRMLVFVDAVEEAVALATRTRDELPEELQDLRDGLLAIRLVGVFFGAVDQREMARVEPVVRGPRGTGVGARSLTAMAALVTAVLTGPAELGADLGREALGEDVLLAGEPGLFSPGAILALSLTDPAEAARAWEHVAAFAAQRGSMLDGLAVLLWGGLNLLFTGDLEAATRSLERNYEGEVLFGSAVSREMGYTSGILAQVWLERGDLARAEEALRLTGEHVGNSDGTRFWLIGSAEAALARGDHDAAIALSERLEAVRPPQMHPVWSPWRSLRARALGGQGDDEGARALAAEELEVAWRFGGWVVGRCLRQLGELEGAAGLEHLREAVALLDASSARLERAKAHAALAAVAAGDEALSAHATAMELAIACGAAGLVGRLSRAPAPDPAP